MNYPKYLESFENMKIFLEKKNHNDDFEYFKEKIIINPFFNYL
jgi:hypothetical protein